jgi:hypothetical protein
MNDRIHGGVRSRVACRSIALLFVLCSVGCGSGNDTQDGGSCPQKPELCDGDAPFYLVGCDCRESETLAYTCTCSDGTVTGTVTCEDGCYGRCKRNGTTCAKDDLTPAPVDAGLQVDADPTCAGYEGWLGTRYYCKAIGAPSGTDCEINQLVPASGVCSITGANCPLCPAPSMTPMGFTCQSIICM